MERIPLSQLVSLHHTRPDDAVFAIDAVPKSTFITLDKPPAEGEFWWASPTALCGDRPHQYNPAFLMAVLSTSVPEQTTAPITVQMLEEWPVPRVSFSTDPDIRHSMTVNAMRMTTQLFDEGSERVFDLARNRLAAHQTDIVHDLLVFLMHALLDVRQEFGEECALRAESIAAFLGISHSKVLLLLQRSLNNGAPLANALQNGEAGTVRRDINVDELVRGQLALLAPYTETARQQERYMLDIISEVLEIWENQT